MLASLCLSPPFDMGGGILVFLLGLAISATVFVFMGIVWLEMFILRSVDWQSVWASLFATVGGTVLAVLLGYGGFWVGFYISFAIAFSSPTTRMMLDPGVWGMIGVLLGGGAGFLAGFFCVRILVDAVTC